MVQLCAGHTQPYPHASEHKADGNHQHRAKSRAEGISDKNDDVDAFVIADKLRFGRITKEVYMDDYRYKALQTLTRARFYAVQNKGTSE